MQSEVAMARMAAPSGNADPTSRTQRGPSLDGAISGIVWFSYCGLISAAVAIMGW